MIITDTYMRVRLAEPRQNVDIYYTAQLYGSGLTQSRRYKKELRNNYMCNDNMHYY